MTATDGAPAGAGTSRGGRRLGVGIGLLAVAIIVVLVALAGGSSSTSGAADDPGSTSPDGAKGLALLIAQLGGKVDTSGALPEPGRGVALVLDDRLSAADRARVGAWVRSGGTLVIADPTSDLSGVSPAEGPTPDSRVTGSGATPPGCDAPWAAGVDEVDLSGEPLLATPPDAVHTCFGQGGAHFAVERRVGQGSVVALASPDLWTNQHLGELANSVLAANLLVPGGGARVAWLTGPVGGGRQGLLQAVPDRVDELIIGGLVAVLVLATWRARRLGRPVAEEVPVVIPGSELVEATGRLLARNGQRDRAGELLRSGAVRDLATSLAVPAEDDRAPLVHRLAQVTGRDATELTALLDGPTPADDASLVALADAIDQLRQEVARAR